jgi:hypothetical protein
MVAYWHDPKSGVSQRLDDTPERSAIVSPPP